MSTAVADHAAITARADAVELNVYSRLPVSIVRGEGCWLFDDAGNRYLDMYGGHAVALTGHCHPRVVEAIRKQAGELLFYSNSIHFLPRIEASELLLRHAPHPNSRVFYVSTGCEANEVAIKIARKTTGRRKIVSFHGAFHGRTLATLSAGGVEKYRKTAEPGLLGAPDFVHVPFDDAEAATAAIDDQTAGVICEAIQSLGGVNVGSPTFYHALRAACDRVGAVLIFDEVQTGFGRTGSYFFDAGKGSPGAVKPDVITLAKGIASGVPCAAAIIAGHLTPKIKPNDHGTTFGGGPLAMAAMKATLQVIEDEGLVANAARVGERLARGCAAINGVRRVRGRGLLLGLEFDRPAKSVQEALLAQRVVVGGSDNPSVMRLLPPLTLSESEADIFLDALAAVLPR
ncbi:MAG: aminotransferase class III-fold pyridoxal phosphate-dependent enzyme [Planctomycetes bacterium]|nr:aminotransferase class III-fold pyridoxal phosphate-dependent enzyme [Planctomycetota bacterium]